MKLLILSSNNGEGHNSAAKALMEQAEARGISAIIADTLMFDSPRRSERIKQIHIKSALYNPRNIQDRGTHSRAHGRWAVSIGDIL